MLSPVLCGYTISIKTLLWKIIGAALTLRPFVNNAVKCLQPVEKWGWHGIHYSGQLVCRTLFDNGVIWGYVTRWPVLFWTVIQLAAVALNVNSLK